jgi:hypothetical protein
LSDTLAALRRKRDELDDAGGAAMKALILFSLLVVVAWGVGAVAQTHVGIVATFPWSVSLQVTFPEGIAVEAGVAASGPAVFAAKLYLRPLKLGGLSLVPNLGLGGAVAFLPGNLTAWGIYALVGF